MKMIFSAVVALGVVATPAVAQQASYKVKEKNGVITTTERLKAGRDVDKITCRQFNALDDTFKPEAVGYAVQYSRKGKPQDAAVDVAGLNTVTPVVVDSCKNKMNEPLLKQVRAAMNGK